MGIFYKPFKDERCMFYMARAYRAVNTPPRSQKIILLMLCKANVAVYSEIHKNT